jgi:hypothetical protein
MFNRLFIITICILLLSYSWGSSFAQEPEEEREFIFEEEIEAEFLTELEAEEPKAQYILADILTQADVEPAVVFYIRDDIKRKFAGLTTNLKLEKIYGIVQADKTATVYFDYSYTSLRNKENILYEKGKMTFIKFNSGKWFNAELSIYLMDSYQLERVIEDQQFGE